MIIKLVNITSIPSAMMMTTDVDVEGKVIDILQATPPAGDVAVIKSWLIGWEVAKRTSDVEVIDIPSASALTVTLYIPATDGERAGKAGTIDVALPVYIPANETDDTAGDRVPDGRGAEADVKQAIINISNLIV